MVGAGPGDPELWTRRAVRYLEQADLVLHPPLAHIDLLAWKSFDEAIEIGYRHANEQLTQLDAATLARLGIG